MTQKPSGWFRGSMIFSSLDSGTTKVKLRELKGKLKVIPGRWHRNFIPVNVNTSPLIAKIHYGRNRVIRRRS